MGGGADSADDIHYKACGSVSLDSIGVQLGPTVRSISEIKRESRNV